MPQKDNNELPWQASAKAAYFPLFYQGSLAGFCRREYVAKVVQVLNDEEKIQKALRLACAELIKQSGGDTRKLEDVIQKYLMLADRPKYGSRAIAAMLRDRQQELNVSEQEFIRFCDTYRLSPQELQEIYDGEEVINSQLSAISRILGVSVEELMEIRDGSPKRS